jgi:hypothetical protein
MKSSIEEQILLMQQKKQELVQTALGNKNVTGEPIGTLISLPPLSLSPPSSPPSLSLPPSLPPSLSF